MKHYDDFMDAVGFDFLIGLGAIIIGLLLAVAVATYWLL